MEFYRIIIADDQSSYRDGLEKILIRILPTATVFNAANSVQVLEILSKAIVDLIFLNINMPNENGIETIREIRKENPEIKIVVISELSDKALLSKLLEAGANGYIHKNIDRHELKNAIGIISNGELFIPEEVGE